MESIVSTDPEVLVTGGTGYIGSHACVALAEAGWRPVLFDNLCNSSSRVLDRIEEITGRRPEFIHGDVRDRTALEKLLRRRPVEAVMHFAGLKAVGESVREPERYRDNNVRGTRCLLEAMETAGVRTVVFSSSATVYGQGARPPIGEDCPVAPASPYGENKLEAEGLLRAKQAADPRWRIACLRYFNPVGAHPSGRMGEDPLGIPNNLMPFVSQVAVGRRPRLDVFGGDYDTPDGTGVRDYIHVMDLVEGHVAALRRLRSQADPLLINLGTGKGVSVLELVAAFERASGVSIPRRIVGRRPGDVDACWADPSRAAEELGWRARRSLDAMCADAWRWQRGNPEGYR